MPIFVLAPLYNVTDSAFRQVIARRGKPDRFYTEFVSADGLMSAGREKLLREFYFTESEQPIYAQIFGANPKTIEGTARLAKDLGFAGLDINMGCPERNVVKAGSCAALIKNPDLAREVIAAAKVGAGELPVTVKTRIGFNNLEDLDEWGEALLKAKPDAITWHLRTKKEESKVPAHWELVPKIVEMAKGTGVKIIANGDVKDLKEAREKAGQYKLDGVMLGRAIFGNPWLFSEHIPTTQEKLEALLEHTKLFEDLYRPGPTNTKLFNDHCKNFAVMKKHFKAYVSGFDGAAELRTKLMETNSTTEVELILAPLL